MIMRNKSYDELREILDNAFKDDNMSDIAFMELKDSILWNKKIDTSVRLKLINEFYDPRLTLDNLIEMEF